MTQSDALDIMKMGTNVFLTGGAGAGKTFILNGFIQYLREHDIEVAVTASTGIAATHMGGMTIHAWSGLGIRDYVSDYDIDQMEEKKYLWDRYDKAKVLIIDEVSMLSGNFLDNLDRICRSFKRAPEKPFGGIQIILSGDLFQLPPIPPRPSGTPPWQGGDTSSNNMVVDSLAWKNMNLAICYITEQHRQDDDAFTDILNAIRANTINDHHLDTLQERIKEFDEEEFGTMTKLFTHNADVDTINDRALAGLDEKEKLFEMTVKGRENLIETLKKSCLAPERLKLKVGAQVMFVKNNFDKGYVNGTRGIVESFDDVGVPVVKTLTGETVVVDRETWSIEDDGRVLASITQVPLRHAWAITVHKSQGMSLDEAVIDLSRTFTYGMGYVALSRVRRLSGLHLVGFSQSALAIDPRVYQIDTSLQELSKRAAMRIAEYARSTLREKQEEFITRSGGNLIAKKLSVKEARFQGKVSTQKTHELSYELIKKGMTVAEAAKERDVVPGTIIDHLSKAKELGWPIDFKQVKPNRSDTKKIKEAFLATKDAGVPFIEAKLTPVKRYLDQAGEDYSFDQIKLVRLFLK